MTADVIDRYRELIADVAPRMIETEAEHERILALLGDRFHRDNLEPAEETLVALLVRLVEDYEEQRYRLTGSTPLSRLQSLMTEHGLRQADLLDVFGSRGIASEVLGGKRSISKTHATRLARRFGVSAGLFLADG